MQRGIYGRNCLLQSFTKLCSRRQLFLAYRLLSTVAHHLSCTKRQEGNANDVKHLAAREPNSFHSSW